MDMIKNTQSTDHGYEAPSCRLYISQMQRGFCVSATAIPPVEEEDAGIEGWDN